MALSMSPGPRVDLGDAGISSTDAARMLSGLSEASLRPTRVHQTYPLNQAAAAYLDVERVVPGRTVLFPNQG